MTYKRFTWPKLQPQLTAVCTQPLPNQEHAAEVLAGVLFQGQDNQNAGKTVALLGRWGSGKSVTIEQFQKLICLKSEEEKTPPQADFFISVDAWQADPQSLAREALNSAYASYSRAIEKGSKETFFRQLLTCLAQRRQRWRYWFAVTAPCKSGNNKPSLVWSVTTRLKSWVRVFTDPPKEIDDFSEGETVAYRTFGGILSLREPMLQLVITIILIGLFWFAWNKAPDLPVNNGQNLEDSLRSQNIANTRMLLSFIFGVFLVTIGTNSLQRPATHTRKMWSFRARMQTLMWCADEYRGYHVSAGAQCHAMQVLTWCAAKFRKLHGSTRVQGGTITQQGEKRWHTRQHVMVIDDIDRNHHADVVDHFFDVIRSLQILQREAGGDCPVLHIIVPLDLIRLRKLTTPVDEPDTVEDTLEKVFDQIVVLPQLPDIVSKSSTGVNTAQSIIDYVGGRIDESFNTECKNDKNHLHRFDRLALNFVVATWAGGTRRRVIKLLDQIVTAMWSIQSSLGDENTERWPSNLPLAVPGLAVTLIVNSRTQPMTGSPFPGVSDFERNDLRLPAVLEDAEIQMFLAQTQFVWAFNGEERWQAANYLNAITPDRVAFPPRTPKTWPELKVDTNTDAVLTEIFKYYVSAPKLFRDEIIQGHGKYADEIACLSTHPLYQLIVLSSISEKPRPFRHVIQQLNFPKENEATQEDIIEKLEERKWNEVFREHILVDRGKSIKVADD